MPADVGADGDQRGKGVISARNLVAAQVGP